MKSEEMTPSGRERDEAAIELLRQLRKKLHSNNISTARLAAFNLSWKQEDGLAILTETLFGNYPRTAKKAAAYGLRSMKGRMKKRAMEVLEQGLEHRDRTTKAACDKAIFLMKGGTPKKGGSNANRKSGKPHIKGVRRKSGTRTESPWSRTRPRR